jgi:hypothetical protein
MSLCSQIKPQLLMPSLDRLEADGVRTVPGTPSGHAILLMHDLMTLREMCHAIKQNAWNGCSNIGRPCIMRVAGTITPKS